MSKSVKHIVIPYKYFNPYDFLSINTSISLWKHHYNPEAQIHIVCDKHTRDLIDKLGLVFQDELNFVNYEKTTDDFKEKYPKMAKTILLNKKMVMMSDKLGEDFIFGADDRFPIWEIDDSHLNKQHKKLGVYPKWDVKFNTNWKWLMEKGAKFMKDEYKVTKPILFKNHYFTKYDTEFVEWFRPYVTRFDLSQMLTYYHLYVKKSVKVKDIFIKDMILTTHEFGREYQLDPKKIGKTIFGISVSAPQYNVELLKRLLVSVEPREKDLSLIKNLMTIKQTEQFKRRR